MVSPFTLFCLIIFISFGLFTTFTFVEQRDASKTAEDIIYAMEEEYADNPATGSQGIWECHSKVDTIINKSKVLEEKELIHPAIAEIFFVAVARGDNLVCERKVGLVNGKFNETPEGDPTIWVLIKEETLNEIIELLDTEADKNEISTKIVDYLMNDDIRVHPFDRVLNLAQSLGVRVE